MVKEEDFYCEVREKTPHRKCLTVFLELTLPLQPTDRAGLASKRGRDRNGGDGKASSMKC